MDRSAALDASLSEHTAERLESILVLINYTDDDASTALLRLLVDTDDTYVNEQAAEALMKRNDLFGSTILFAGVALA